MPHGLISKKSYSNGLQFASKFECEVYNFLKEKYSTVQTQVKYQLTDYPSKINYILDFETDDFYCEAKGNYILRNRQEQNEVRLKSNWFASIYRDKPLFIVFNGSHKAIFKNIKTFTFKEFKGFIS